MGRFTPDMKKVSAGFPTIESGEWEFTIGEAKPFSYTRQEDGVEVCGVRYPLRVVGEVLADGSVREDEQLSGKNTVPHKIYLHTEAAWGMAKQFLVASAGYAIEDEDAFNEEFGDLDYVFDTEDPEQIEMGDGWEIPEGRRVRTQCSFELDNEKRKRQNYGTFVPVL